MASLRLAIDARGAASGANIFAASAKRVKDSASDAVKSVESIGHAGKKAFDVIGKAANIALGPLKAMVAVSITLKASITAAAMASIGAAADYEMFNQQLQTVIATKKLADQAFKESIDFAVRTPFTPSQIIQTRVALESVGVKGKKAVEDVASAAAAMNREMQDVASAVISLETEPLRRLGIQLSKQGDDFLFKFRDRMGQAQQIAVKGYEDAQQALLNIFGEKFEGGLDKMSLTWQGLISTLQGATFDLRSAFGEGFLADAKLIVNDMLDGIGDLRPYALEAGQALAGEIEKGRAALLAGFDVSLEIAKQIKDVLKQEDGAGKVVLEALNLGADLLGTAIISAFRLSIPLWKSIGTVLGEGVLNALYLSDLPGTNALRASSIRKNVSNMDFEQFSQMSSDVGFKPGGFDLILDPRRQVPRERDVEALIKQIQKLPADQQVKYAGFNAADAISENLNETRQAIATEMKVFGESATQSLQNFANDMAAASGQTTVDIAKEYNAAYAQHIEQGKKLKEQWNHVLDPKGGDAVLAESNASSKPAGNLQSAKQVDTMFQTLELERSIIGKTNDERERAIEMTKLQALATEAYGEDQEKVNAVMDRYRGQLEELQKARKLQSIADGIGDSFASAFERMATGAASASDAVKALARDIAMMVMRMTVTEPIARYISAGFMGAFGGGGFSGMGGGNTTDSYGSYSSINAVAARGMVVPAGISGYSNSIVDRPTVFPFAKGVGLMGEAGPEAIMPLKRTADGRLGISGEGTQVVNNINIENRSSQPVNAKVGETKFDGKQFVTSIILEDLGSNGPIARNMKSMNEGM